MRLMLIGHHRGANALGGRAGALLLGPLGLLLIRVAESPSLVLVINDTKLLMPCV